MSELAQSAPRTAVIAGGSAAGLMVPLHERAKTLGVRFELNERVERILTQAVDDDIEVVGLEVVNTRTHVRRRIRARRGIVLASGGFAADADFRQRYNQRLSPHVGTATQPGSTSEVLAEAARIGAWLVHLQYITCVPDANPDEKGWGLSWQFNRYCAGAQGLWVKRQTGRRFVNEMSSTAERTNAVFDALNEGCDLVAIADARAVRHPHSALFGPDDAARLVDRGFVQSFDSLEALAQSFEIPYEPLIEEVQSINKAVQAARSRRERTVDRMGRPVAPEAECMEEGPWYAAPLLAKVLMCGGGIAIDLKARVLSIVDDRPIRKLFAAGEVTGGLFGIGDIGACSLLDALVFGRIAGREAAKPHQDNSNWKIMSPLHSIP